jgi:hypothetical protein
MKNCKFEEVLNKFIGVNPLCIKFNDSKLVRNSELVKRKFNELRADWQRDNSFTGVYTQVSFKSSGHKF